VPSLRECPAFASGRLRDPHTETPRAHQGGVMNDWHIDFTTEGFSRPEDED